MAGHCGVELAGLFEDGPTYERSLDRERYYGAAPPPVYDRAEVGDGACRILHERRVGPYGRETIYRIRICDEGPAYGSPTVWL